MSRSSLPLMALAISALAIALLPVLPAAASVAERGHVAAAAPESAPTTTAQEPHSAQEQEPHAVQEPEHGAERGESEVHAPSWMDYAFKWINFVLLAALLWWLLVVPPAFVIENFDFPGLKVVLAQRSTEIVQSRDLAREQTATAASSLADSQSRLQRVEEEVAGLLAAAEEDGQRERERIVAAAEDEAERIRRHAQRDMGSEVTRARRDLKRHVADLAVGMAADLLEENISTEDQSRLVRDYLDRLGETAVGMR